MPINKVSGGYQWGNHGKVYPNRIDAEKQAAAAHAFGYTEDESFRGAGIVLIAPDNTVLFTLRSESCDNPNTWCFPGGQQDGNESPQETAIRETCEEAGYIAKDLKPFSTYTAKDRKKFYLFKSPVKHKFTPKLSDESTRFIWSSLDNPPEPLHYGVKAVLDKIARNRMAQDADKWITVHPNGANGVGRPALIGENGEVKGGMGGKFNGKKLGELKETRKTSEMSVSERESSEAPARQSSAQNKTPANPSGVKLNKNQNSIVNKINHLIGVDITKAIEPRFTKGNRIQIHTSELPNNALNQIKRISNQYGGFTVQEGGAGQISLAYVKQ